MEIVNRGGRPERKFSKADRRSIEQMAFCGESIAGIARAFDCDPDTLQKHCDEELLVGKSKRRREVTDLLFQSARKGNVAAQKHLDVMGRMSAEPKRPDRLARDEPLGKKEQAAVAAREAPPEGSKWAGLMN